jgi:hypothetical protein
MTPTLRHDVIRGTIFMVLALLIVAFAHGVFFS